MKTDSRGPIAPITQPARATGSSTADAGSGAGQGSLPGRPFSFVRAVKTHVELGDGDGWRISDPNMHYKADHERDVLLMRRLARCRAEFADEFSVAGYIAHVLPIVAGRP